MKTLLISVSSFALAVLVALGTSAAPTVAARASTPRPSITIRVNDTRITAPGRTRAGYVDVRIVASGKVHHHLAFWHLNRGVTVKRFTQVLKRPNGDPFRLGTAVGGNGPMLAGRLDTTMRLRSGRVVLADIVEGPTTRVASLSSAHRCPLHRRRRSAPS
jgi:hypothetical protein